MNLKQIVQGRKNGSEVNIWRQKFESDPEIKRLSEQYAKQRELLESMDANEMARLQKALEEAEMLLAQAEVNKEIGEATEADVKKAKNAVDKLREELGAAKRRRDYIVKAMTVTRAQLDEARKAARQRIREEARAIHRPMVQRALDLTKEIQSFIEQENRMRAELCEIGVDLTDYTELSVGAMKPTASWQWIRERAQKLGYTV